KAAVILDHIKASVESWHAQTGWMGLHLVGGLGPNNEIRWDIIPCGVDENKAPLDEALCDEAGWTRDRLSVVLMHWLERAFGSGGRQSHSSASGPSQPGSGYTSPTPFESEDGMDYGGGFTGMDEDGHVVSGNGGPLPTPSVNATPYRSRAPSVFDTVDVFTEDEEAASPGETNPRYTLAPVPGWNAQNLGARRGRTQERPTPPTHDPHTPSRRSGFSSPGVPAEQLAAILAKQNQSMAVDNFGPLSLLGQAAAAVEQLTMPTA
ncbi:hypothetical protein BV25DRAFT_1843824, partial [Artomyces pyxidatus]